MAQYCCLSLTFHQGHLAMSGDILVTTSGGIYYTQYAEDRPRKASKMSIG
jgi:hypothetical protein